MTVYRVYGDDADQRGQYWTPTDPRQYSNEEEARQELALLPEWNNSMERVVKGTVDGRNIAEEGIATPRTADNGEVYRGGATEVRVIDPNQVTITEDAPLVFRDGIPR